MLKERVRKIWREDFPLGRARVLGSFTVSRTYKYTCKYTCNYTCNYTYNLTHFLYL